VPYFPPLPPIVEWYRLPWMLSIHPLPPPASPPPPPPPRSPPTCYPRRLRPGPSLSPRPDIVDTRTSPPPQPLYLIGRRGFSFSFGVGCPRRGAVRHRLTLRSPPTRTRRALFGWHAAADGLRRIISSLAGCLRPPGCELDTSFSARMILSDVLICTVPLPCVAILPILIKNKKTILILFLLVVEC
jgi:hypothetical protein